jgi:hypothetical protein
VDNEKVIEFIKWWEGKTSKKAAQKQAREDHQDFGNMEEA